jgi:hypothetical protein
MVRQLGKRKWLLIIAVVLVAVVLAAGVMWQQELVASHMYPRQALHENSNLSVKGIVLSIEENYARQGYGYTAYHYFRYYIRLNITEVVWLSDDLSEVLGSSWNGTSSEGRIIGIGYEYDAPEVEVGQNVECRGYYVSVTDTPYSYIITVAPTVSESFLKPQT